MIVLSLFDGISCARVACKKTNIKVKDYYASEIDKYAIKISLKNHPEIKQLGNVIDIKSFDNPVDILIGGSPCQDLSLVKRKRKGLEGNKSSLFWEYVRIKEICKPKWFILENVASMSNKDKDIITNVLSVEPIMFDASLVSAQQRKRYFWTNIPFTLPTQQNIVIGDIIVSNPDEKYFIKKKYNNIPQTSFAIGRILGRRLKEGKRADNDSNVKIEQVIEVCKNQNKSGTLTCVKKDNVIIEDTRIRFLTPIEYERLQGLPDNYTEGISNTQRYKCLGNAFNVDVVAYILSFITIP